MIEGIPLDASPVAVIEDRYGGCYSGGAWLAISAADREEGGIVRIAWCLAEGPSSGDTGAAAFWGDAPEWIAVGDTPDKAVAALMAKIGV